MPNDTYKKWFERWYEERGQYGFGWQGRQLQRPVEPWRPPELEKAFEKLIPRPEVPAYEPSPAWEIPRWRPEVPVEVEPPSMVGEEFVSGRWIPTIEEREPITPREFAVSRGFPAYMGGIITPQEAAEALIGAPAVGFEEYIAKPFAATVLSPFYKIEDVPAWQKLLISRTADAFPEGKAREAYMEWKAPWGLKGTIEIMAWIALPAGVKKPTPLFKQAEAILQKLAKGKRVTKVELGVLEKADKLAKKENVKFAESLARAEPAVVETKMPTIVELIGANYNPNLAARVGEKLTRMPGIAGQVNRSLLPMQAAKTPAERATIAWGALTGDVAPSLARIEMDVVLARSVPFKFVPPLYQRGVLPLKPIEEGLVKNVVPRLPKHKPYIQSIMEFPDRYILSGTQRAEVNLLDDLLQRQLARELAVGVKVLPTPLKPGQRYFPRFINELMDLETKAITEIKRGVGRRPGIRPASFRERYYEEVLDGIVKGKRYSTDYRAATEMRLATGNKAIADKMLADYLTPLGRLPKETISAELAAGKAEITGRRSALKQVSELIEHINAREPIKWYRWLGIKKWYPEQYASLQQTVKRARSVPQELRKFIVAEKSSLTERSKGLLAAYRFEMRLAKKPILGMEGSINHAGLQGRLFPVEISEPTNALIMGQITPHQVLTQFAKVNAVARMGQTAIDTGFQLIQLLLTAANFPKAWGRAFVMTFQTLKNPKYMARWSTIPEHAATKRTITSHGGAPFAESEFTEAARRGGWLLKLPGIGKFFQRFGNAFESALDTARISITEGRILHYTQKYGRALTNRELTDVVTTVDHMVGIGSLTRLGMSGFLRGLATNTLYAPRYYLAFVSLLGRAFQGGIGGDIARKALAKFLIAVPAFMSAIALALGQKDRITPTEEKPVPRMFDPRTGEFMTVEVAGTHMGLGGVWIAGFRLLGSLTRTAQDNPSDFVSIDPHENPILRYPYGRASPVLGGFVDVATGHNYLGERLDTIDDYLMEVIDKTFPFWLAGRITDVPKSGWEKGLAEWWGLRAWMVQYREEARRHAEAHIKDIPDEMIMPWQKEKDVISYDDLNNEQRAWLLLTFEDYREAEDKRKEEKLRKGTDLEVADIQVRELLDSVYESDIEDVAQSFMGGLATITEYQDQAEYMRRIRSGQYQYREELQKLIDEDRWEDLQRWIEERIKPEDLAYDKYMELRGSPPDVVGVPGVPDWDAWKYNIDAYLNSLDTETRAYIERRQDDWISKLPPTAQKTERLLYECEKILDGYYGIPEGRPRLRYREGNPDAEAKLFMLGRITSLSSKEAIGNVEAFLTEYGIDEAAYPDYLKEIRERRAEEVTALASGATAYQDMFPELKEALALWFDEADGSRLKQLEYQLEHIHRERNVRKAYWDWVETDLRDYHEYLKP